MKKNSFRIYNKDTKETSYFTLEELMNGLTPLLAKGNYIIMSSPDIKDKHDTLIFENDIVKGSQYGIGYIQYREDLARYTITFKDGSSDLLSNYNKNLEVIGTMMENSNLIN